MCYRVHRGTEEYGVRPLLFKGSAVGVITELRFEDKMLSTQVGEEPMRRVLCREPCSGQTTFPRALISKKNERLANTLYGVFSEGRSLETRDQWRHRPGLTRTSVQVGMLTRTALMIGGRVIKNTEYIYITTYFFQQLILLKYSFKTQAIKSGVHSSFLYLKFRF